MIFVGFPMYQPPSFLSSFPKITEKKFIQESLSLWLFSHLTDSGAWNLSTSFPIDVVSGQTLIPSFWPWVRYSSICWDFQLAISQQFILRDAELWPSLLWMVAFLPCAVSGPVCDSPEIHFFVCWLFVISSVHVGCWHPTNLLSWQVSYKCLEYISK